ncbi:MAG: PspA/IM30 family protein [Synechocystis sp.]
MAKRFIYWFIGKRAGTTLFGTWHWFWGIPVERGGKVAVEVAKESLESMQLAVANLTDAAARVIAAQETAKTKYEAKRKEFDQYKQQALLANQQGNQEIARLAMMKAIMTEKLLPTLAGQLEQSEKMAIAVKEKLSREREKLETYKFEMQNLKVIAEVNEALGGISDIDSQLNLQILQDQFAIAQSAIERKNHHVNAKAELAESPAEKLEYMANQMTLNDEVERRLELLIVDKN